MFARSFVQGLRMAVPQTVRRAGTRAGAGSAGKSGGASGGKGKWVALAMVGGFVGAAGLYFQRLGKNKAITAEDFHNPQGEAIATLLNAPRAVTETDEGAGAGDDAKKELLGSTEFVLYAYSACPFSGKVRTFLKYHGIKFTEVEVEPMFKSQISDVAYSKIPQLEVSRGSTHARLVDSEAITDLLAPLVLPPAELHALHHDPATVKWRSWGSEELVRLIVVYINQTLPSAVAGYAYIDRFDAIPWYNKAFLKVVGAPVMYLVARFVTRSRLAKLGYTDDQLDTIDTLHAQVDGFVASGLAGNAYHGGDSPDIVDLDVYGIITAMKGHPVYDSLVEHTTIGPWLERMDAQLQ